MTETRIITAALPFVNAIPHLGNIIGSHLPADVFARWCKLQGHKTYFVGGTDEHGTAIEFAAQQQGKTPQQLCDELYQEHKKIYDAFGIEYDNFSRTSRPLHYKLVQEFFTHLYKNGFITEKTINVPFCLECKKGLADRYIKGTCPHCQYDKADGDQCEKCATVLTAQELQEPHCAVCHTTNIEFRETKHLFLDLQKVTTQIEEWIDTNPHLRSQVKALAKGWLKQGIEPRCITRDLQWGVPVPLAGYEDKVFYVWFDNVLGYVSSTVELLGEEGKRLWQQKTTKTYYFVGKDNIPFHTIFWPGQILGDGRYVLPYNVVGLQYLNFEGKKFSKSKQIGIFGDQVLASSLPIDYWRFYLISVLPETKDTDFSLKDFQERINKELIGNYGNLVNRTVTFIANKCSGTLSKVTEKDSLLEQQILGQVQKVTEAYEACNLREALAEVLRLSAIGNQYFDQKAPWKTYDQNALWYCHEICRLTSVLLLPILPTGAESALTLLQTEETALTIEHQEKGVAKPTILFKKIDEGDLTEIKPKQFPLHLITGHVEAVAEHPTSDRLFVFTVDCGILGKKQCVTSLRTELPREAFFDKTLVFCANLKPAKFRGELSEVMILAGETEGKIVPLEVPVAPGTEVHPKEVTNNQQEITFEQFQHVELKVQQGNILWEGKPLVTAGKRIEVKDLPDGAKVS